MIRSMPEDFKRALAEFAAKNGGINVLCGGDGTLVGSWKSLHVRKGAKPILPVRDYGLCRKHQDFYMKIFIAAEDSEEDLSLKQFLMPVFRADFTDQSEVEQLEALAEVTVVGADPTSALRFAIKVDGRSVAESVIANGVILAAKLGSTGYFKSVARTIFTEGIGIGFICPTYSVPNVVVPQTSKVQFVLERSAELVLTADKLKRNISAEAGWTLEASDACDSVSILGYDHFMCPECRKLRNSTIINDSYFVS